MAVVEVAYEKYSELVEREIERIYGWAKGRFQSKISNYFK